MIVPGISAEGSMKTISGGRVAASALMLVAALAAFPASAQPEHEATALTIYSTATPGAINVESFMRGYGASVPGYAVVREARSLDFKTGHNTIRFTDVAARIDPTTVAFESLTDPTGTTVTEQNFQFDLVSRDKLLHKYIDRQVTVNVSHGDNVKQITGTLLSTLGGLAIRTADGSVLLLSSSADIRLPALPGGLITRPTLVWEIHSRTGGTQRTRVSYRTAGMTWWTDYNATYHDGRMANRCTLDVGAWVTIVNQSGAGYPDTRLKLVAGNVHRAPAAAAPQLSMMARMSAAEARPQGFQEKSFFEYHLYTLGRTTTLPDNSTKQIELFPVAHGVPCEKRLVYYGGPTYYNSGVPITNRDYGNHGNKKVDIYLTFRNSAQNNIGVPLPAGVIRVSKLDPDDGTLEFVGEDLIDHTPKDESVRIKLGSAFDVVGERRQTDFKLDTTGKTMTESIEIELRNHKTEPVTVQVREPLYRWGEWQITAHTQDYVKVDAHTIRFPVKVAADGTAKVGYTVRYTW
jgi:hypothetical protein